MARREIFAGNWKMHKDHDDSESLIKGLLSGMPDIGSRVVAVFPPVPYVKNIVELCKGSKISVGIQNMYYEEKGAFTGEVSPLMVKDIGCRYILIGHSERRHVFGETDEEVNKKVKAAFKNSIDPMICIGELLEEREKGQTSEIVHRQLKEGLKDITEDEMKKVVVAYEPVWAIGTGKVATPETAEEVHKDIRGYLKDLFNEAIADTVPILYGGSVKPDNIAGLYVKENIDGVLVGGASLEIDSFLGIVSVK